MRAKWEGTYTQLQNGKWRVQIAVNGTRISYTAANKRAAQKWVAEMRRQAELGMQPERLRVSDALQLYMQHLRMSGAASTVERTTTICTTYANLIGSTQATKLTPARLNKIFAERLDAGYAPGTIAYERRILRAAMQRLVREGMLARNPVSLSTNPRIDPRDYTAIDARAHAAVNRLKDHPLWIAYALLLATGMRVGELLGLTWADITRNADGSLALRIERSDRGQLKTAHSRRVVTVGEALASTLESKRGNPNQRVILTSRSLLGKIWRTQSQGLRLHDLRHAHASELLAAGVPITAVSRRLGHASVNITLGIYAHLVDTLDTRVTDVVSDISRRLA